jgi:DNA polymerase I
MKVVIDVEANALKHPTKIWCIVCKDIDTGEYHVFNPKNLEAFKDFSDGVHTYIGHNILGWDCGVLNLLLGVDISSRAYDTLILSKLIDYPRQGHSIEDYGKEFGLEKGKHNDFTKWSQELEDYCKRDCDICLGIYNKYLNYIMDKRHHRSIKLEHDFARVVSSLNRVGFAFDSLRANRLLAKVNQQLGELDHDIKEAFPPRLSLIREIHPKSTKFGTLDRKDFRWYKGEDLSEFNGGAFCRCEWKPFNASSHKQLIEVLSAAGWVPTDKTQAHKDAVKARTVNQSIQKYGWKINEENLSTLPPSAPKPARLLSKRILLESRRRTLTEWLSLVKEDGRVHGEFYGIGAWTHRMSHSNPNMANIPTGDKLYAKDMRALFKAPRNRLLVGVDAEGIQLRIFAHYIDDKEFTHAIVHGKKSDGTDPHSLNRQILGSVCKSRDIAKRYIYALLLGAGAGKLRDILSCTDVQASNAYENLIGRYTGLDYLRRTIIPRDAKRGWFVGLDGRRVRIPGSTPGERKHLAMSGYLQNGEIVIMKMATLKWFDKMQEKWDAFLVNLVHDEWQSECPNDAKTAIDLAKTKAESLKEVGEELGLKCPLLGSYWSDAHNDYSIGVNWSYTH